MENELSTYKVEIERRFQASLLKSYVFPIKRKKTSEIVLTGQGKSPKDL